MLIQLFRSITMLPGVKNKCVRSLRSMKSIAHYLLALLNHRGKTTHVEVYAIMLFTFTIGFHHTGALLPWELFTASPISHKRVSSIQYDSLVWTRLFDIRVQFAWLLWEMFFKTLRAYQGNACKRTWLLQSGLRFVCTPECSQLVWGQSRFFFGELTLLITSFAHWYMYHYWWSSQTSHEHLKALSQWMNVFWERERERERERCTIVSLRLTFISIQTVKLCTAFLGWITSVAVLICKSLWIKASAKWINVNVNLTKSINSFHTR